MFTKIDKHSGIPAYIQIMNQIKKEIYLGYLKTNEKLPTIREMQKIFSVNINTVSRALEKLSLEGLIESQHGVGYFVRNNAPIDENFITLIKTLVKKLKNNKMSLDTAILIFEEVWKNEQHDQ
ncbi:hypothetical protein OSSY52_00970 [Tepiditoga spiralis]|uniref:HTH gntR-type domain-containing protein n=1 Tax=Tepiditoga spiralis TaxID=2108365 RepID=A0A7G1G423_9BACT|nr:GntR family transcriptional regulator [Tepiditoga spiralis]BBE29956.1 hypothetical protein OSSY52_00970 [Tepiditoga spiralis]